MSTTLVRRFRRLFADRPGIPHPYRSAVTVPAAHGGRSVRDGDMFAAVHSDLRGADRVHGGSTDLTRWPASLPEEQLAVDWLATGEPATRDELYAVCGSVERACAIALDVRARRHREAEAEQMMLRVFGPPTEQVAR